MAAESKIIILDYASSDVHVFDYDKKVYGGDYEAFYEAINEERGFDFKDSQCSCMIVDGDIDITIH